MTTQIDARPRTTLVAMTLANAMILVDQTAIPLALPSLQRDLGISQSLLPWVLNASLLPLAGALVLGGRLSDAVGRRRIFLVGAVMFGVASGLAGLAPTFPLLLVARVVQGLGGALMLPTTIAIVSSAFDAEARGRALGVMGGAAAVAAAFGPTIGGLLTSLLSWRAVLLVNVPLLVVTLVITLRAVAPDAPVTQRPRIDYAGAALLGVTFATLVIGLSSLQTTSRPLVTVGLLVVTALAAAAFVWREHRTSSPLIDFRLLREHPNYLGATISQAVGGMAEMGLGLILPLVLLLNLGMDPAQAGLALIATTLPMVVVAPLAGRWYDRSGGRPPLALGYVCLAAAGLLLVAGLPGERLVYLLPGLLAYGVGLAVVLSVNDPVTLDTVPDEHHGQAAGVSATAEQFGGALGVAGLYALFHAVYVDRLFTQVDESSLPDLDDDSAERLKAAIVGAERTGLDPAQLPPDLRQYLEVARTASEAGYAAAFVAVSLLAVLGLLGTLRLVRRPDGAGDGVEP